jgi:hypothetical protein
MLAEMVGTTRSRVNFFMDKFKKLGFIKLFAERALLRLSVATSSHLSSIP